MTAPLRVSERDLRTLLGIVADDRDDLPAAGLPSAGPTVFAGPPSVIAQISLESEAFRIAALSPARAADLGACEETEQTVLQPGSFIAGWPSLRARASCKKLSAHQRINAALLS